MRTEEQFEDTLKEIEMEIVRIFRRNRDMTDYAVGRALEGAAHHYRAIVREHVPKPVSLTGLELALFDAVQRACECWLRGEAQRAPLTAEDILQCLRRLQKSVNFWTRESGRQGYLTYVDGFIP